jgi:hypothetical protein
MREVLRIGLAISESLALYLSILAIGKTTTNAHFLLVFSILALINHFGLAWFVMFYLYLWKWNFVRELLGLKERPHYIPSARMIAEEEVRFSVFCFFFFINILNLLDVHT